MAEKATMQSRAPRSRGSRKIKFGDVTIIAPAPSKALVLQNVNRSTQALERFAARLAKPGVNLRPKKGIPLFSLDSDDPDVVIRKLNGKIERGRIVDGTFCAID